MKNIKLITLTFVVALLGASCAAPTAKKEGAQVYNAVLDGYEYPHDVHLFEFDSQKQKLKMAYMYLTKEGANNTAVLLHGKNFSGFYWEKTAQLLLKEGYNVLIPDQIGFGKSSKPENYQYSFSQLALNTKNLMDSLKIENATIIGHSMGGMLATKFNKIYPTYVKKLILVNPIGLEDYLRYTEYKDVEFFYKGELKKNAEGIRKYQMANYYDGKWSDEYEELIKFQVGQTLHQDWPVVAWNNALTYDLIFSEPIVDDFKFIKNPAVLILGTRDRTGPGKGFMKKGESYKLGQYQNLGKRVVKNFKNAKLIELDGLGHMPQFEDFDRYQKALLKSL